MFSCFPMDPNIQGNLPQTIEKISERIVAVKGDGSSVQIEIDLPPAETRLRSARIAGTSGRLLLECGSALLSPIYSAEVLEVTP